MKDDPPTIGSAVIALVVALALIILGLAVLRVSGVHARDVEGHFVNSPLKQWFDSLASRKGPCCSDADGTVIKDADWDVKDGHYRVRMPFDGEVLLPDPRLVAAAGDKVEWRWIDVPDEAVIKEPNKFGPTMVWAVGGASYFIRCFMPGAMI